MITKIYKIFLDNDWSFNTDQSHNKRLGIHRCIVKHSLYCEIYKESYGFNIHLYGRIFTDKYNPLCIDIIDDEDLNTLKHRLNTN